MFAEQLDVISNSDIVAFISELKQEFLKKNKLIERPVETTIIHERFSLESEIRKFVDAIRKIFTIENIDQTHTNMLNFIKQNTTFVYHGTSDFAAKNIIKSGWNLSLRGSNYGQTYGIGEYFTSKYDTAKSYSMLNNKNGVVLLAMTILPSHTGKYDNVIIMYRPTIDPDYTDAWYIVNNTNTEYYAIGLTIVDYDGMP